jgi:hypothetical protein
MTKEKSTDAEEMTDGTPVPRVLPDPETNEETAEEVVSATPDEVEASNAQHSEPLFTGDLGGHVLNDSTPAPGAAEFASTVRKNIR